MWDRWMDIKDESTEEIQTYNLSRMKWKKLKTIKSLVFLEKDTGLLEYWIKNVLKLIWTNLLELVSSSWFLQSTETNLDLQQPKFSSLKFKWKISMKCLSPNFMKQTFFTFANFFQHLFFYHYKQIFYAYNMALWSLLIFSWRFSTWTYILIHILSARYLLHWLNHWWSV